MARKPKKTTSKKRSGGLHLSAEPGWGALLQKLPFHVTSAARANFAEALEGAVIGNRCIFMRYGRKVAALVSPRDAGLLLLLEDPRNEKLLTKLQKQLDAM